MSDLTLAICIPSTGLCRIEFMVSVAQAMVAMVQEPVFPDTQQQCAYLRVVQSSGISTNREQLVKEALELNCSHVCFVDEDMVFPRDAIHRLLRHQLPFVAANYRLRAKGGDFCAMSLDKEHRVQTTAEKSGVEPCAFVGFGLAIISTEIFRDLKQPWFPIHYNYYHQRFSTEDQPFCERVRNDLGISVFVDHDVSREVQHIGHYAFTWDDNGK